MHAGAARVQGNFGNPVMYQTPAARRSNRSRVSCIGGRDAPRRGRGPFSDRVCVRSCPRSGQRTGRKEGRKEMTPIIRCCGVRVRCCTHTCTHTCVHGPFYVETSRTSRVRNMALVRRCVHVTCM